eukprot:3343615-Alexandrium_andersonii.AAC.1
MCIRDSLPPWCPYSSRTRQRERECGQRLTHQCISVQLQALQTSRVCMIGVCTCLYRHRCQHAPDGVCTRVVLQECRTQVSPIAHAHIAGHSSRTHACQHLRFACSGTPPAGCA